MASPHLDYQVVSETVHVVYDNGHVGPQEFRVTVPEGSVPVSGGYDIQEVYPRDNPRVLASYPDGSDWVFVFLGIDYTEGYDAVLYVVCI